MSDKERKILNTLKDVACGRYSPQQGTDLILSDYAVESGAPAPQPDAERIHTIAEGLWEQFEEFHHTPIVDKAIGGWKRSVSYPDFGSSASERKFVELVEMVLSGELERAATPQVTPTPEYKYSTGSQWDDQKYDPKTGEVVEGTSEQASPVSFVSEISYPAPLCEVCGAAMVLKCLSCGSTPEPTEPASPTPEVCPSCGSDDPKIARTSGFYDDGGCVNRFHSSASTPKGNTKD